MFLRYLANIQLLLLPLVFLSACTHPKAKNDLPAPNRTYDFSYTGSLYSGDTMKFISTALSTDTISWFFGCYIWSKNPWYTLNDSYPCDTCDFSQSAPVRCDISTKHSISHVYYSPGTYTVTFIVNNDTAGKVTKTITILSPDALAASSHMGALRHWSRIRTDQRGPDSLTTTILPDTAFALIMTPNACRTPNKFFDFNTHYSNSHILTYCSDPDVHIMSNGKVTCNLTNDSVFIQETSGGYYLSSTTTYKSGY